MADIKLMRSEVSKLYPNETWRRRVRLMSDSQVQAIYISKKESKKPRPFETDYNKDEKPNAEQLSFLK